MKNSIGFSLQMARDWCIDVVSDCPTELVDVQVEPFQNTIRWHTGHILTVAERMLFRYPESDTGFLPVSFSAWFAAFRFWEFGGVRRICRRA